MYQYIHKAIISKVGAAQGDPSPRRQTFAHTCLDLWLRRVP